MNKKLKGILTLVLIFVVLPFGVLALLWKDRCKTTQLAEALTEGDTLAAVLLRTDCGTSMKIATEVRVERREHGKPVAHETVLLMTGSDILPITWSTDTSNPTLTIGLPKDPELVKRRGGWGNVSVVFQAAAPSP